MATNEEKTKELMRYLRKEYCKKSTKFILTNLGLGGIMIIYTVVGALMFMKLEQTNEKEHCLALQNKYIPLEEELSMSLWKLGSTSNQDDKQVVIDEIQKLTRDFRSEVLTLGYDGTNCSSMGEEGGSSFQWSFSGSLLFAVTVFATVGYGNIAPQTYWGRFVCIIYAVIGTPLMLVFLANIGEIMAEMFKFIYSKVCCCGCLRKREENFSHLNNNDKITLIQNITKQDLIERKFEIIDEEEELISVPLTVTLGVIGGYLFMGALLFGTWEGWTLLTSAYYCFITISTIGFGDVVPGTGTAENDTSGGLIMIGAALYMVFGMAIMSMAFNLIQEEMVTKFVWLSDKLGLSKKDGTENEADKDEK